MWICCLTAYRFLNPLYQLDCVCRVEAEEDNQDFRLFDSAVNPFESAVFFLYPQAIGQISCNVIFEFVIVQRIPWDDSDTTDWGIFCNHIQRHTIGLSALSAWRLPDGRQSGSGKGRSHPTNEVWRIHQRHFTMFLSRIITSRYIAVKWLRRVYWLTSHEHRRFSRLAPTILLLRIDDSFRKHRRLFFKSPWMLGEVVVYWFWLTVLFVKTDVVYTLVILFLTGLSAYGLIPNQVYTISVIPNFVVTPKSYS